MKNYTINSIYYSATDNTKFIYLYEIMDKETLSSRFISLTLDGVWVNEDYLRKSDIRLTVLAGDSKAETEAEKAIQTLNKVGDYEEIEGIIKMGINRIQKGT